MKPHDLEYQILVKNILNTGDVKETRNGRVHSSFYPHVLRFERAPLLAARQIPHHYGIVEMDHFINQGPFIEGMDDRIRKWWEPFKVRKSNNWFGTGWYTHVYSDIFDIIEGIKNYPDSRRHVLSSWDYRVAEKRVEAGTIPNCHTTVSQFYVCSDKKLHYKTYQRSADVMLGIPFNLIQHWALLTWVARRTSLKVGSMSYILGDAHIYEEHLKAAREVSETLPTKNTLRLKYEPRTEYFCEKDFTITGYYTPVTKEKLRMSV